MNFISGDYDRKDALPEGTVINGYQIMNVMGEGAFSITYLAYRSQDQGYYVLKENLPGEVAMRTTNNMVESRGRKMEMDFQKGLSSFITEASILAGMSHPNIVMVTDVFPMNGTAYLAMPYLDGHTLQDWIQYNPQPTQTQLEDIFIPLLDGLHYIHSRNLLHRDIKPDNIHIGSNGNPRLIDFGAARFVLGRGTRNPTLMYTPHYAPLEQQINTPGTIFSAALDLYGLAASMYMAITHTLPVNSTDRLHTDTQPRLSQGIHAHRFTPHFLAAIDKSLNLTPEHRHQSAHEMQRDLLQVPQQGTVSTKVWLENLIRSVCADRIVTTERVCFIVAKAAEMGMDENSALAVINEKTQAWGYEYREDTPETRVDMHLPDELRIRSPKSRDSAAMLAFFPGAHRFYVGRHFSGLVMLLMAVGALALASSLGAVPTFLGAFMALGVFGLLLIFLVSGISFNLILGLGSVTMLLGTALALGVFLWTIADLVSIMREKFTDAKDRPLREESDTPSLPVSPKNFYVTTILLYFFWGCHRLYLERFSSGALMFLGGIAIYVLSVMAAALSFGVVNLGILFSICGAAIWGYLQWLTLCDLAALARESFNDAKGRVVRVSRYASYELGGRSLKSRSTVVLLLWLLPGAHRLYVGRYGSGLLMLLTLGGLGLWTRFDLIAILKDQFTDRHELVV